MKGSLVQRECRLCCNCPQAHIDQYMAGLISWGEDTLPDDADDNCEDEDADTKEDFDTFKAWLVQQPAMAGSPAPVEAGLVPAEPAAAVRAVDEKVPPVPQELLPSAPSSSAASQPNTKVDVPGSCPLCHGPLGSCNLAFMLFPVLVCMPLHRSC